MKKALAFFFIAVAFAVRFVPLKIPNIEFISSMIAFLTLAYGFRFALPAALIVVISSNLILTGFLTTWDFIVLAGWTAVSLVQFVLRGKSLKNILFMELIGTLAFFAVTNSLVFFAFAFYPRTLAGYIQCIIAGIPFLRNQIIANFFLSMLVYRTFNYSHARETAALHRASS